jgi:hypothetical protein
VSIWNSIGSNPFLKTLFSQIAGAALAAAANSVDTVLTNPTGGTQAYLTAHPVAAVAYVIGVGLFHNYVSSVVNPRSASTNAPVTPPAPTNPAK